MKVKGFLLDLRWTTAKEAATLDRWMHSQVGQASGRQWVVRSACPVGQAGQGLRNIPILQRRQSPVMLSAELSSQLVSMR